MRQVLAVVLLAMLFTINFAPKGWAAECSKGKITCSAWCNKYEDGGLDCIQTDPKSCVNKYGSADFCVSDSMPKNRIHCMDWCTKCDAKPSCFNSCPAHHNRLVDASCSTTGGG